MSRGANILMDRSFLCKDSESSHYKFQSMSRGMSVSSGVLKIVDAISLTWRRIMLFAFGAGVVASILVWWHLGWVRPFPDPSFWIGFLASLWEDILFFSLFSFILYRFSSRDTLFRPIFKLLDGNQDFTGNEDLRKAYRSVLEKLQAFNELYTVTLNLQSIDTSDRIDANVEVLCEIKNVSATVVATLNVELSFKQTEGPLPLPVTTTAVVGHGFGDSENEARKSITRYQKARSIPLDAGKTKFSFSRRSISLTADSKNNADDKVEWESFSSPRVTRCMKLEIRNGTGSPMRVRYKTRENATVEEKVLQAVDEAQPAQEICIANQILPSETGFEFRLLR